LRGFDRPKGQNTKGDTVKKFIVGLLVVIGFSVSAVADRFNYTCVPLEVVDLKAKSSYEFSEEEAVKFISTFIYDSAKNNLTAENHSYEYKQTVRGIRIYQFENTNVYISKKDVNQEYQYVLYTYEDQPFKAIKNVCQVTPFY